MRYKINTKKLQIFQQNGSFMEYLISYILYLISYMTVKVTASVITVFPLPSVMTQRN